MSFPITAHFGVEEFACHDGTPYPVNCVDDEDPNGRTWLETRLKPLCDTLEIIRAEAGAYTLTVDSGYRTPAYDERLYEKSAHDGSVAPASRSQHPKGRAADIRHGKLRPIALFSLILELYQCDKLPHLGGLGLYPTFVHVDIRPRPNADGTPTGGHLAIWGGQRPSNVL
jgi:hypothetical protein